VSQYRIVFSDYYYPHIDREREVLSRLGEVEIVDLTRVQPGGITDPEQLLPFVARADALIHQFARVTAQVIEAMTRCRVIARYAIGLDTVDLEAARAKGIKVANVPDYCIEEVSDTAIAHIFNCLRKVALANGLLRSGGWSYDRIKPIRRFSELTVGLVAFGNIARRVAEKLRPFGVGLAACDPYFDRQEEYGWVRFGSLEEVLGQADIVSLHAPLTEETKWLIDRPQFEAMKKGVILVNTSRGGLINEAALAEALKSGQVAQAGLDVVDKADVDYAKSELLSFPEQVFITPHMGWYSEEAIADLQRKTALNVYEVLKKT